MYRHTYIEKEFRVKSAIYTVRLLGTSVRVRMTHLELLNYLRRLYAARRAA